ncbi:hypothetical protein [Deinococcus sp. Leaf326]|uniref:hypothetical protein n=1 Tax=Deinococcus sp. Leaf326 TaxID=1736338 RepID=UPI0006F22274|nr:hypothetical protein [Deinococcus sp. Leaf326]KQR27264.1 hypothetical protein ASF71_17735 [Deinococcus sp. Leaf326]
MSAQQWQTAWQTFDELYLPHEIELQALVTEQASLFELAYADLDDARTREGFTGTCYGLAKQHGLPAALVDWWRTLQVYWVEGGDNHNHLPDMIPLPGRSFLRYQTSTLRAFRVALAKDTMEEVMFLAAMLEAIRASEAQRIMWNEL